jgi:hypothetical protein
MASPLFTNDEASDPGYRNIRDGKDPRLKLAKWHCQYLWMLLNGMPTKNFRRSFAEVSMRAIGKCI